MKGLGARVCVTRGVTLEHRYAGVVGSSTYPDASDKGEEKQKRQNQTNWGT